jgi:hypothetical protein
MSTLDNCAYQEPLIIVRIKNLLLIIPLCRWTAIASASMIQEHPDDLNVRPSDLHELLRACSCESALIQRELADVRAQMLVLQQEGKNDMSDFAHGVKSGRSSVASLQRRHNQKIGLRNCEQALDLRLGAVLYVHNQTLLSLREDAGGIVKLAKGWSTAADAVHTSLLERVLQREEAIDGHDGVDATKSVITK